MKKILFAVIILFINILDLQSQTNIDSIQAAIRRLSDGFAKADIESINREMSDSFSLGASSYPGTNRYILPILNKNGIKAVEFISIDKTIDELILVNTALTLSNEKKQEGIIAFDANNKIVFADVIDKLFGASRYNESRLVASIPFEWKDNAIILSVRINDSKEYFKLLFDTGADGCALTKLAAEKLSSVKYDNHKTEVVGGHIEVKKSSGNTFHLSDAISLKNQGFIVLADRPDSTTDGIIGLNIAKAYVTEIDFDKKMMNLYSFGDYKAPEDFYEVPIQIPSGIMEIDGSLNIVGKKEAPGKFIFDTGANYHLIGFEGYVRKNRLLLTGFKTESQGTTVSLGLSSPTFSGHAHSFTFANKYTFNNMPVTLQASTGRSNITTMSGSIGIRLIEQFNFIIDVLKKRIYLKKNENVKE